MFCAKGREKKGIARYTGVDMAHHIPRFPKICSGFALGVKAIEASAPVLGEQLLASGFHSSVLPAPALVQSLFLPHTV